jgi:selenocysteine lyase/cysteine desulfurase
MARMDLERLIAQEFPLREDIIHLNHAAVAPWPQRTVDAVIRFARENAQQGSLAYGQWLQTEAHLRAQLKTLINAPSSQDIALLKNTSEGLSIIAQGLPWQAGDNIVTADEEFPSNRIVWESLARRGVELREAALAQAPTPEDALFAQVDEHTRLITVSSVQYGSGLRLDLARIGAFCRAHDIRFCVDAIQSLGALALDAQDIGADFVVADGHKWMLGPEGVALFYCRAGLRDGLQLTQYGWHMLEHPGDFDRREWEPAHSARRFECGSPNLLGIHALSASLSLLEDADIARVEAAVLQRARLLFEAIAARPELELMTDTRPGRFGGIIRFRHRGMTPQALHHHLSGKSVLCAQRAGGVRFSPHFYTAPEKLTQAVVLAAAACGV